MSVKKLFKSNTIQLFIRWFTWKKWQFSFMFVTKGPVMYTILKGWWHFIYSDFSLWTQWPPDIGRGWLLDQPQPASPALAPEPTAPPLLCIGAPDHTPRNHVDKNKSIQIHGFVHSGFVAVCAHGSRLSPASSVWRWLLEGKYWGVYVAEYLWGSLSRVSSGPLCSLKSPCIGWKSWLAC